MGLLGGNDIRELAGRLGVRPSKQRGQNFMVDPNMAAFIARSAELAPDEHVLEIGPGLGSLTLALLPLASRVTAVEIEPAFAAELPATAARFDPDNAHKLEVVLGDALRVEVPGEPSALVANLPYNVAVPVLLHLLATKPTIRHGLVLVQAEVADRLVAEPGSKAYGIPSLKLAWYAASRRAGSVGPHVFWPVPNVDSGLVRFTCREAPGDEALRIATFACIDAAFSQRRKTLRSALATWAGSTAKAEEVLVAAGVAPTSRGEQLGIAEFVSLASAKSSRRES